MPTVLVNGRRIEVPDATTPEQIARAGGIRSGRRIIRQTREGNYPVKPGDHVQVQQDDKFVDAPQRVKGF
ncbi:MAG: hypothetical protein ABSB33_02075 [Tepidisphaeraceae bacterium]